MNTQKFKESYSSLLEKEEFRNYIKDIIKEYIIATEEYSEQELTRKITGLDAMINDPATTPGEKRNAADLKQKLQNKLQNLQLTNPKSSDFKDILASYGFEFSKVEDGVHMFKNSNKHSIYIYPETNSIILYRGSRSKLNGKFNNLETWMSRNTNYKKIDK